MGTKPEARGALEERIGSAFRSARVEAGISLMDMANALGCSINTVRWHEAGARLFRADDIVRAASIMDVPPDTLLGPAQDAEQEAGNV